MSKALDLLNTALQIAGSGRKNSDKDSRESESKQPLLAPTAPRPQSQSQRSAKSEEDIKSDDTTQGHIDANTEDKDKDKDKEKEKQKQKQMIKVEKKELELLYHKLLNLCQTAKDSLIDNGAFINVVTHMGGKYGSTYDFTEYASINENNNRVVMSALCKAFVQCKAKESTYVLQSSILATIRMLTRSRKGTESIFGRKVCYTELCVYQLAVVLFVCLFVYLCVCSFTKH